MRKLTQKLVLSVVTMALVVIALGTSTFAWFTLTNKASISAFQGQVTAGEGIEITLGDWNGTNAYTAPSGTTTWYTVLPESVIETYILNMQPNFHFDNVTSPNGATINNESGVGQTYGSSSKYIQFQLYFRSSAAKKILWSTATLSGTEETWKVNVPSFIPSDQGAAWTLNSTKTVAAWTGARISIVGSATVVYQAPEDQSLTVLNSNDDIASFDLALVDHDSNAGTPAVAVVGAGAATPWGAAAYGIAAGKDTTYGEAIPTVAATSDVNDTPAEILTLTGPTAGYYTGSVIVRIWIEGFDADTFDAIFDTELSVLIGFEAVNI